MAKKNKFFALMLLTTLVLMSALSVVSVEAQGTATVVVLDSVGGTVAVSPSGTTFADGTDVTLTPTPTDAGFVFVNWIISTDTVDSTSTDDPLVLTVAGGVTYAVQAVFQPIQAPPGGTVPNNLATAAIVVVLPSAGGTTVPAPGTYAIAEATSLNLQATAQSGWQFSHWTICGTSTNHGGAPTNWAPTDNPYNVNHGYGYTYYYQAVFVPVGSSIATPTPAPGTTIGGMSMETVIIIALVVVIVVILIAFGVFMTRRHPK
jgi:hypothetical protein